MQNLYHLLDRSQTFQNIYTYGNVNSIFVKLQPDSMNIKNDPRISTWCSDETQISLFLPWLGYFGIVLDWEKSCRMNLQVYQSFKHIQFYLKYQRDLL